MSKIIDAEIVDVSEETALAVIAIAKGKIPNVRISY